MAPLKTTLVHRRHAWTGLDVPWRIDVGTGELEALPEAHRAGWRLFHYLSGGGLRAFAGTLAREVVSRRQTRFLWFTCALGVFWVVFRFL